MRWKLAEGIAAAVFLAAAAAAAQTAQPAAPSAQRPIPTIAAPTPTAPFTATAGRLAFDRACGALTFDTLASNSACAARVARGETGPTLEVAVATIQAARTSASVQASLVHVERAIAAENHAAAHYFAGSVLSTGEFVVPDYVRAVAHLERAVAGGNVAAADLLASLLLSGRGTAQDISRAIALYERAAAGGMDGAATRLALLYLTDRHVPRDVERGRRILEAAAAVDVRGAREALRVLEGEPNARNYQIHPDPDPARVEVRTYPTLAIPEVPPSFGFTDDFRRTFYAGLSDPAILARLERDHATLPTPFLFELARRTIQSSPQRALGWLFLARMRLAYDTRRCLSRDSDQALGLWDRVYVPEFRAVLRNMTAADFNAARSFALEREAALPGDQRPWWVCYGGLDSFASAADGPPPLRLQPEAQWERLRRQVRGETRTAPVPPRLRPAT